jgi:hypothetical protein
MTSKWTIELKGKGFKKNSKNNIVGNLIKFHSRELLGICDG